jgi:N-acetyl-alpha-D-muramate 1-phosphate uridylyltransferase
MGDSLAGLVLAAGAGVRMMPLSRLRPKALMPLGRSTLVDQAIARVRQCTPHIVVNVHHGRHAMSAHLAGRVVLSIEDEPGLGTAGGVARASTHLDGCDLVVVNADTWCPGDLGAVVGGWDRERVRVVVAGHAGLGPGSRIVASMMPWSAVADLPGGPSGLYEVCWAPLAAAGRLDVVGWEGPVIDCATPRDLLTANLAASRGQSVIGDGALVEGRAVRSVVWPGAHVWPAETLVDAIRTDADVTVLVR